MRHRGFRVPRRYGLRKLARIAGATLVVLLLAGVMSAGALYFLLRGESVEDSALNRSIKANIQNLLGPDYIVDLGSTAIAFDGLLSVAGKDVRILRAVDRQPVSTFSRVLVGVQPLSLLGDEPKIDSVVIEDSTLDARLLPLPITGPPSDLDKLLSDIGRGVQQVGEQFSQERFRLFRFTDVKVRGVSLGRRESDELVINDLEVRFQRDAGLKIEGEFSTQHSSVVLDASYTQAKDDGSRLEFTAEGIALRDWLPDPQSIANGPVGWDAKGAVSASISFDADGRPDDPEFRVAIGESTLRLGRYAMTDVKDLRLNFQLLPSLNQIDLVPSLLSAGNFNARLVGRIRPADPQRGYQGPLQFELIAAPAAGSPTVVGEKSQPGAIRLAGKADIKARLIDIPDFEVRIGKDRAIGSASFGFRGETPSIAAAAASDGLSIAAIKQFWPYWIAPPARDWALRNIVGGRATNITIDARIPSGIIARFRQGKKMAPDQFNLSADFSDVRLDSFGELPAIRSAQGHFDITGMTATATLGSGVVFLPGERQVDLTSGTFKVFDFGERPALAEVQIAGKGQLRAVAEIANAKPLTVLNRIDMRPGRLSGESTVDVTARFPLTKGITREDVDWNATIDLENAASSEKIQGRKVADADVHVEVSTVDVKVTGRAVVDGVPTKVEMTEPIGGSDAKSEHVFTALVDDKTRNKMGLSLDPVVSGNLEVRYEKDERGVEKNVIDLKDAELSLPWVGWSKGKGIAASASFKMREKGGVTNLDDFYLEGEGFSIVGSIAFDKKGVVSADFTNVTLNQDDLIAVQVSRKGKRYIIKAEGPRYDARGLINKLIHEGGFGDAQGDSSVVLTAKLGKVRGFGGRVLNGVSMSYGTVDGWLDNLSLRGTFSDTEYVSVVGSTQDRSTTFEVDTSNAGAALAMMDVYRHMNGGRMIARLKREAGGAFNGPVDIRNFVVEDEPRLEKLVTSPVLLDRDRDVGTSAASQQLQRVETHRVRFLVGRAIMEKGQDYLRVSDGVLRSPQIGFTFDGMLYDPNKHMSMTGTFMPGLGLSRAIGMIPLVGELLGNGRETSLMGITFRLSGPAKNPAIEVNPFSAVAPGVFRKVFEYGN